MALASTSAFKPSWPCQAPLGNLSSPHEIHLPCLASSAALASHLHHCCCLQGVESLPWLMLGPWHWRRSHWEGRGRGLGCLGLGRGACRAVTCSTVQQGLSSLLSDCSGQKHARCPGVAIECSVLVIIVGPHSGQGGARPRQRRN